MYGDITIYQTVDKSKTTTTRSAKGTVYYNKRAN